MKMYWIYDLPLWLFRMLTVGTTVAFSVIGLLCTRPLARRIHGEGSSHNDMVNNYIAGIAVFYSLTLGMLSVGVWERYENVKNLAADEGANLAVLFHSLDSYPEPVRTTLLDNLAEYVRYQIEEAGSLQRAGIVPTGDEQLLNAFQKNLFAYEPETDGQSAVQFQVLQEWNDLMKARRLRLQSINTGLPSAIWLVVLIGAAISIGATWLLVMEHLRVHVLLTLSLAAMIGLLIYLMAALDNPGRSQMTIRDQSVQTLYSQELKVYRDSQAARQHKPQQKSRKAKPAPRSHPDRLTSWAKAGEGFTSR
ncbi:MAG: hypothetical protein U0Z53_01990 [Blastocatellia bacterium]